MSAEPSPLHQPSSRIAAVVAVRRHRVEVAGEHEALSETEVGAGEHVVAEAAHLEAAVAGEDRLDVIGDGLLVPAHRRDVD